MMSPYYIWSYVFFVIGFESSIASMKINEAPAKVTFRMQVSKLNHAWSNASRLKLCIHKLRERCYWALKENIIWDGDQYKEISYTFYTNNMSTNMTLEITIEHLTKKIDFPKKTVNLMNFNSKSSFEMHPFNLESFITVTIEHECENGYYPPKQCTKMCFPMPNESDCDSFGNKICKNGLQYDAQIERCIANNCAKFNIRCENGRCINKASTFECVCLESYFGKFCQYRNPCYPNPCSNGRRCIANLHSLTFTCSCSQMEVTDGLCSTTETEKCQCPENMRCQYDNNGVFQSCISKTVEPKKDMGRISTENAVNNNKLKVGEFESAKPNEWNQVSLTTTVVAAIGCMMLLLCVCISLYVCFHTREHRDSKRNNRKTKPSLAHDPAPTINESSFQRSFSLEDNSAYLPPHFQILPSNPNNVMMGSSHAYSLHTNSYQDNHPQIQLTNGLMQGCFMNQQNYPITPLLYHPNYPKGSTASTPSGGSFSTPPLLPPRSNDTELTSFGTLPKAD